MDVLVRTLIPPPAPLPTKCLLPSLLTGVAVLAGLAVATPPASAGLFGGEKQWAGVSDMQSTHWTDHDLLYVRRPSRSYILPLGCCRYCTRGVSLISHPPNVCAKSRVCHSDPARHTLSRSCISYNMNQGSMCSLRSRS